jgi:hypothetical protein
VLSLIPVAFVLWFVSPLSQFFRQTNTPAPVAWMFLGFLILFFGVLPAMTIVNGLLRERFAGTIVTASASGIRIQGRGAWKTGSVKSITAAEILDIDFSTSGSVVVSSRDVGKHVSIDPRAERVLIAVSQLVHPAAITIKTQRGLTTFGQGLADDEIRYVYSLVRGAFNRQRVKGPGIVIEP